MLLRKGLQRKNGVDYNSFNIVNTAYSDLVEGFLARRTFRLMNPINIQYNILNNVSNLNLQTYVYAKNIQK